MPQRYGDDEKRYGDYKDDLDQRAIDGELPRYPADFTGMERRAAGVLPDWLLSYVQDGAGDGGTQRANVEAFARRGLVPRMMRGTSPDMSTRLFGIEIPHPLFLCPIGALGIITPDEHGDLAAARAAARTGVPMVVSTLTQDPLEDIAAALGDTPGFFQLYIPTDRDLAISFIQRAERAGFQAVVVTVDTWLTGWRPRDLERGNFPQRRGMCLANYFSDTVFRKRLTTSPELDPIGAAAEWHRVFSYRPGWEDLVWIRETTSLPIVLKGINHPEDVRKAIDLGVDGIYCSNHGGRHANGGLSALQMLPAVVDAAGDTPVLFDSGVRSGTDLVKALATGAAAVGTGRPYVNALAVGGADGVEHHLRSFLAEADRLMALDGYASLAELRAAGLQRVD